MADFLNDPKQGKTLIDRATEFEQKRAQKVQNGGLVSLDHSDPKILFDDRTGMRSTTL